MALTFTWLAADFATAPQLAVENMARQPLRDFAASSTIVPTSKAGHRSRHRDAIEQCGCRPPDSRMRFCPCSRRISRPRKSRACTSCCSNCRSRCSRSASGVRDGEFVSRGPGALTRIATLRPAMRHLVAAHQVGLLTSADCTTSRVLTPALKRDCRRSFPDPEPATRSRNAHSAVDHRSSGR